MTLPRILVAFLASLASAAAAACTEHAERAHTARLSLPPAAAVAPPYWAGAALSGSWYDAARDGEGFILEWLPSGDPLIAWFTYPPAGKPGAQTWLIAVGQADGAHLRFDPVYQSSGGVWGDAFDPARIVNSAWGTLDIDVSDCRHATLRYSGPAAYGSGERALTRLTTLDQLDCEGQRALTASGARARAGLRAKSGAWAVDTRLGEGWFFEELPGDATLVYWFTFDPQGNKAWMVGVGARQGARVDIADLRIARGTHFGADFDAAVVERPHWGELHLDFSDCDHVGVRYASALAGYGSGTRAAQRLTSLGAAVCLDGTPAARTQGSWQERSAMPPPTQSELDVAVLDGGIYALGGFGDPRGAKRYDAATDRWSELPDLPAGRDHLLAFAFDGSVYIDGGYAQNGDDGTSAQGYRYDAAAQRWVAQPELLYTAASRAAVLGGRVYTGTVSGGLIEYDLRRHASRFVAPPDATQRDHAQVIAFLGEIWVIGGRAPETRQVAIYDPVSQRWRQGPPIQRVRGGFAAAVVGDQIVIAGGEVLGGGARLEPSLEVYAAGDSAWKFGPALPIPVHGTAGAAIGDRFYVVSGSTNAGLRSGATGRLFSIVLTAEL